MQYTGSRSSNPGYPSNDRPSNIQGSRPKLHKDKIEAHLRGQSSYGKRQVDHLACLLSHRYLDPTKHSKPLGGRKEAPERRILEQKV